MAQRLPPENEYNSRRGHQKPADCRVRAGGGVQVGGTEAEAKKLLESSITFR